MTAALVIIPACFAYGMVVGAGPGLLFVTLPTILQNMPFGRLFAIILFTAVVFGGVSSLQNMFEVVGESLLYKFPKLKRNIMLVILAVICFGIGVNMEPIFKWGPWMDIISIYIIPIGATLGAVSWFWIMKKEDILDEINKGRKREDALRGIYKRTGVDDISSFMTAVIQSEQLGSNIANMLRVQSHSMRQKRRQRAEETAMKVPVKMLFPLVFFMFPALFIVILGPAVIRIIRVFSDMF